MMDFFEIGAITSTHGLKGEVSVFPLTDDIERFYDLRDVLLETQGEPLCLSVERVRFFKGRVILKFKGLDRIEDVEQWKGRKLLVSRENAVALKENEFYIGDIIGSGAYLENGELLGEITDIRHTGANDVYYIRKEDGSEILLPSIAGVILRIEPEERRVLVRPMKEI